MSYLVTVGVHALVFLASMVVLSRFVFSPALKIFRLRREKIDQVEVKEREVSDRNSVLEEEYNWRMEAAAQLANEKFEITKLMGSRRSEMILNDVKRETIRDLDNVVKSSDAAYEAVVPTMGRDIAKFADEIVDKLLKS